MLELKKLCLTANDENGKTEILKNIDLTVGDNKFLVITGPNGGGKTSLAKAVMGIMQPSSGQILWNGEDVTAMSVTERAAATWTPASRAARSSASRSPRCWRATQSS